MGSRHRGWVGARGRRRWISSSSVLRQPWRRRTGFLVLRDLAGLVEPERGRILGMGDFYHMAGTCGGRNVMRKPLITPALFSHRPPPDREKREKERAPRPGSLGALASRRQLTPLLAPSLPAGGRAMGERGLGE